jgi:hypothetical protein
MTLCHSALRDPGVPYLGKGCATVTQCDRAGTADRLIHLGMIRVGGAPMRPAVMSDVTRTRNLLVETES